MDKLEFPKNSEEFSNLTEALKAGTKRPALGVTQGGSSRKWRGARVAATEGAKQANR